jgi:Asp-tRNA(Asn)/Glu-tRNA(Gln) amidotransferase B subunit
MGGEVMTFPQFLAKFLLNDFTGLLKKHHKIIENCGITPGYFGMVVRSLFEGLINRQTARNMLESKLKGGRDCLGLTE